MKRKAYLGIDIGSISTKGVIIDENNKILAECYLWTEGNPTEATKKVLLSLKEQFDPERYRIVSSGTTGSARKLVGSMIRRKGGKKRDHSTCRRYNDASSGCAHYPGDRRTGLQDYLC